MHTLTKTLQATLALTLTALTTLAATSSSAWAGPRDDDWRGPAWHSADAPRQGVGRPGRDHPGADWGHDRAPAAAVVDARQARQQARIEHGRAVGAITRAEYRDLMAQQQQIHRFEQQARADGRLNWQERERLDQMLDRASASIRHQVRDDERAGRRVQFGAWHHGARGDAQVAYERGY